MYKIASILPANIPIKMAIINMYKTILVSDTISLVWSWWQESNPWPEAYKATALPTELHQHGREDRIRTCDLMLPKHVFYQAELLPYWVDGWESNSQPPEPQSGALPIELPSTLAPPAGIEPATFWLTVICSTNWATEELPFLLILIL